MSGVNLSGIRDNHNRGGVGDFLKDKIQSGSKLSFVSAYFTIYAHQALKEELDSVDHLRFLFGEPKFIQSLDPEKTDKKAFDIEDSQLQLKNRLEQKLIAKECAQWIKDKVDVRSVKRPGFLHGKMYHMENGGVQEALLGSSNFTVSGLGLSNGSRNNIELNLEVNDNRDRTDLLNWFDEIWADEEIVEDVKAEVLSYLEQLYENHPPEFIYFKTLFHIFEGFLSEADKGGMLDAKTGFYETKVWDMLYEFQKDGVKGAINKILRFNGCIIADSVGLGKTFEALAVIKYFEKINCRVLVLCPKKLRENWTVYRENDERNILSEDQFSYTVLSHTDLSRDGGMSGDVNLATHNWGNYGLIVIDESHNFRNNTPGKKDESGEIIRRSRYQRLMEDILQKGVDTKVLLLSATPLNTNLKDLRNQMLLITQGDDHAYHEPLDVYSIAQVMKNSQAKFSKWADHKTNPGRKVGSLLESLDSAFFKLMDALTIARSRRHIENYYNIEEIGKFPERLPPIAMYPEIDLKKRFPTYDDLNEDISQYQLSIFNPSKYLPDEHKDKYIKPGEQKTLFESQSAREKSLIGMMKVNYLKRLESSIEAFELSIDRTIKKIEDLIEKIKHFDQNRDQYTTDFSQLDMLLDMDDDDRSELEERLMVGKKLQYRLEHLNIKDWLIDLEADRKQLCGIYSAAVSVTPDRDAKLKDLKEIINAKLKKPLNDGNKKVVVFTAFADTAHYLYENLKDWALEDHGLNIALVAGTGENRATFKPKGFKFQTHFDAILTNFSPRSKNRDKMQRSMPQEGEIDILIATDCISEGQNLQDCDFLVNYDIHWNPVRIIQRFGRIDRLGSINTQIQLVNFWPTPDLNKYINLKERVEARMALVDLAATGEDDLLNTEQIKDLLTEELSYREKQLLRLKDEVLDLEEMDDNVSLSEFTLDDFRIELLNYLEANRRTLEDAPMGLYGIVPTLAKMKDADLFDKNWHEIVKPGVIFCLRHKNPPTDQKQANVNPLSPYYLVYIRNDGEVRFGFTHVKQILSIFQNLCRGKEEPYKELCDLFDRETQDGKDMTVYNELLGKTVKSISKTFKKRIAAGLQSGRGFVIPDKKEQVNDHDDFELITWLVIKG
ncbi:helicase-related protein [Pontiellaceae bacterium B12227]|nr:helicase-related protein [Pontiellaceae bacterium B12227]